MQVKYIQGLLSSEEKLAAARELIRTKSAEVARVEELQEKQCDDVEGQVSAIISTIESELS